jgi:hypothetical protein
MPTVIREFARASAGEVGGIAAGVFSSGELVTAVRNGSDNLELIVWDPDATNRALTRGADSGTQAGEVGEIALAMMGRRCLTAVQNANGYLLVIPWALESDGTLSRLEVADHQAGKASYLAIAPLSETLARYGSKPPGQPRSARPRANVRDGPCTSRESGLLRILLQKSFCVGQHSFSGCTRGDRIIYLRDYMFCDELTGDFGNGLEATSVGNCGSLGPFAGN